MPGDGGFGRRGRRVLTDREGVRLRVEIVGDRGKGGRTRGRRGSRCAGRVVHEETRTVDSQQFRTHHAHGARHAKTERRDQEHNAEQSQKIAIVARRRVERYSSERTHRVGQVDRKRFQNHGR